MPQPRPIFRTRRLICGEWYDLPAGYVVYRAGLYADCAEEWCEDVWARWPVVSHPRSKAQEQAAAAMRGRTRIDMRRAEQ